MNNLVISANQSLATQQQQIDSLEKKIANINKSLEDAKAAVNQPTKRLLLKQSHLLPTARLKQAIPRLQQRLWIPRRAQKAQW